MLISSLNLALIYAIVRLITKQRHLALITAAIFSFSPGYFHLSMLALEINLAMPLLLAGILCYLKKQRAWGWTFFALSFFTYNGFRPLIPFLLVYLEFYHYLVDRQMRAFVKNAIIVTLLFIAFFAAAFFFVDGETMTSRSSDIVFLSYDKITPEVVFRRNTSVAPDLVKKLFDNKITETLQYMIHVGYEGVSLQYLFFKGDSAAIYTSTFAGQFLSTFIIFYFLGFMFLGKNLERKYLYILGFIPVALVSSLVNIDYVSVAIRSLLASVGYAYIMALGVLLATDLLRKMSPTYRRILVLLLVISLSIEGVYFGYNYIFRRPVTMFESYFEHERQLANYVLASHEKVRVYDDSPKNLLTAYHILNPHADIRDMQKYMQKDITMIDSPDFTFIKCPRSDAKQQMYTPGTLIAHACLDPHEYDALGYIPIDKQILFKDFSLLTAYFIYTDPPATGSAEPPR
jgi:hypothetical protein